MISDQIIDFARECIGTPFHHQARICGVGLDCAGVVCHVADKLGMQYTAPVNYARTPQKGMLEKILQEQKILKQVFEKPIRGDVLLMRFGREPQHLAIYTGSGIIHAYETVAKCVEHDLDDQWENRIVSVYRFVENE